MVSVAKIYKIVIITLVVHLQSCSSCKRSFFQGLRPNEKHKDADNEIPKSFNISEVIKSKVYLEHCECGTSPDKSPRIAGGEEAAKFEFPWQAALVYRNTRVPFCGGSLINDRYVLTAAHCVLNLPKMLMAGAFRSDPKPEDFLIENDFQVLLSAHKLSPLTQNNTVELYKRLVENSWNLESADQEMDFNEGTLRIDVSKRIFHHGFVSEYRKFGFDYDVALLRLRNPVNLTARNAPIPICLPNKDEYNDYRLIKATTIGWGRTDFRDSESGSPVLKKIQMPVYSLEECSQISGVAVSSRFICAGHQTKVKDIGKTDSGGPLLIKNGNKYVQIGIVSWGAGERDGHVASAFTRITEFLPWIYSKMKLTERANIRWCAESGHRKSVDPVLDSENEIATTTTETGMDSTTTTATYLFDTTTDSNNINN